MRVAAMSANLEEISIEMRKIEILLWVLMSLVMTLGMLVFYEFFGDKIIKPKLNGI